MHPSVIVRKTPDKLAIVMAATGESLTYRELEDRTNRGAQLFRKQGLRPGNAVAIFMENHIRFLEICWAAQRAGLYYTCISSRLTAAEAAYIVKDCGARLLVASHGLSTVAQDTAVLVPDVKRFMVGGGADGFDSWEDTADAMRAERIADEVAGADMLYSSGTTGRPKGVRHPLLGLPIDTPSPLVAMATALFGLDEQTIYLSPAPLYHAAPLRYCMTIHRLGGTVIVMEHFDAEESLKYIQHYGATGSQWVPTMFIRMLKLPADVRLKYDVSTMKSAIHAAAPCPIDVKRRMIEWWGPIIHEYYAGTEGNGFCYASSSDWLAHPGTVGRSLLGEIHICGEDGAEVPMGEEGTIYFAGATDFEYHNDAKKTAESRHPGHADWSTLGDVGRLDKDGFLYLTDRKAFMIISGGVNVYPQETENVLVAHPKVVDVAVIGVPNEEFGEEVKAVVQPANWRDAGPALAEELIEYCRGRLSPLKCPRSIDFEPELPRHPTGKLYKRLIRDRYWGQRDSRIV